MGNGQGKSKKSKARNCVSIYHKGEVITEYPINKDSSFIPRFLRAEKDDHISNMFSEIEDLCQQNVIGLRTRNRMYGIDFLLMNDNFECLQNGDELEIMTEGDHEHDSPILNAPNLPSEYTVTIFNYKLLQTIGKGGFSLVYITRNLNSGKIFACKSINSSVINKWKKSDCLANEIKILNEVNNPFVIKMIDQVQTKTHTHLILEFCLGGDLFYLLSQFQKFPEKVARFYLCEIIIALEHLHSLDIFYRDLKPTNVLLDEEGHIKLTDFGLSLPSFPEGSVSTTFCGTPEYMAPEMLLKNGHDRSLDYYSCGIILYEMLVGLPPFYSHDRTQMYTSIIKDKIKFLPKVSKTARDLIKKLTMKNPKDRLGSDYGFFAIKQHPFFKGVDWKIIAEKKSKAPFIPSARESNFHDEFTSIPIQESLLEYQPSNSLVETVSDAKRSALREQSTKHKCSIIENRKVVENEHEDWLRNVSIISEFRTWRNPQDNTSFQSGQECWIKTPLNVNRDRLNPCSPTSSVHIESNISKCSSWKNIPRGSPSIEEDFDQKPYENIITPNRLLLSEDERRMRSVIKTTEKKKANPSNYLHFEPEDSHEESIVFRDRKRKISKHLRREVLNDSNEDLRDYIDTFCDVSPEAQKQDIKCFESRNSPLALFSSPNSIRIKPEKEKITPKSLAKPVRWITPIKKTTRSYRKGRCKLPDSLSSYIYYNQEEEKVYRAGKEKTRHSHPYERSEEFGLDHKMKSLVTQNAFDVDSISPFKAAKNGIRTEQKVKSKLIRPFKGYKKNIGDRKDKKRKENNCKNPNKNSLNLYLISISKKQIIKSQKPLKPTQKLKNPKKASKGTKSFVDSLSSYKKGKSKRTKCKLPQSILATRQSSVREEAVKPIVVKCVLRKERF
ncbi:unnamed protein product [Moneuplotes crassus]|uniref:Protein kinase domain-containing protein n=1 Tax=Euplotes crassus TaxID=5936 RepID=A0AAD1XN50_EUPCR|nr:unnamed protein product [Moneuplotes crassus]